MYDICIQLLPSDLLKLFPLESEENYFQKNTPRVPNTGNRCYSVLLI